MTDATNERINALLAMINGHYEMDGKRNRTTTKRKDTAGNRWLEDFSVQFSQMIHHNQADYAQLVAENERLRVEVENKNASLNNGDVMWEKAAKERDFAQNQRKINEQLWKQSEALLARERMENKLLTERLEKQLADGCPGVDQAQHDLALGRIEELEADAKFMDSEVKRLTEEAEKWKNLHQAKNEHMTTHARAEKVIKSDMEKAIKGCEKALELLATLKCEQSPEH